MHFHRTGTERNIMNRRPIVLNARFYPFHQHDSLLLCSLAKQNKRSYHLGETPRRLGVSAVVSHQQNGQKLRHYTPTMNIKNCG